MTDIAEMRLLGVMRNGSSVPISLAIGVPNEVDGVWRCGVTLNGIDSRRHEIAGGDSLQSLLLASRFMRRRLVDFTRQGGRLFVEGGGPSVSDSDFPFEAYFGQYE